ncbi:hypothetical protein NMY22_g7922 [Coprinellus aureogranulatus]|nr:hypothetical protein NMY22_g7922 [Coprinellus aureogranulatus]
MASKVKAIFSEERNPRGIPKAPFIANVDEYMAGSEADIETTLRAFQDAIAVTECVGGSMKMSEEELGLRYQSFCDPRLNFEQSLDVAFMISDYYKKEHKEREKGRKEMKRSNRLFAELGGRAPPSPVVGL